MFYIRRDKNMPCYKPLKGYLGPKGITFKRTDSFGTMLEVPCGRCIGCRLDKARDWALRCYHEASLYEAGLNNCFITLTYDNHHLPSDHSLVKSHFTKFIKALRQKSKKKIRFYMCGEYGKATEKNNWIARPHYHAILFGYQFPECKLVNVRNSNRVYISPLLTELWRFGSHEIGTVTFQSAGYVARYVLKKQNGDYGLREYAITDLATGEITDQQKIHPYTQMSLKPGIGKPWYDKHKSDLFPHDYAVLPDGRKCPVPTYYRNLLKADDPALWDQLRSSRIEKSKLDPNSTPERLATREFCKNKQAERLKREL